MNILTLVSTIILIFSFMLVGLPVQYNCIGLNIAIIIIGLILAAYKLFLKKEKFTINKVDLFVLLFCVTPILSIIFKTYYSFEDTLILLIRNISLFNIYFILKETICKHSNSSNDLVSALIVGGVILAILGILEKFGNIFFYQFLDIIKAQKIENVSGKMVSVLGYPNPFAIIMAVDLLLCINRFKENKILYSILIALFGMCCILSLSTLTIAILLVTMFIYLVIVKKSRKNLKKIIIVLGVLILFIVVATSFTKPLKMTNETKNSVAKTIYNVEKNKEYTFNFDLESKSENEEVTVYSIILKEKNKYDDILYVHQIDLKNESGKKELKFVTDNDTKKIELDVKNSNKKVKSELNINSATVNGKKIALSYRLVPLEFVEKIRDFRIDNASVAKSATYITDGFKIAMNHFLAGAGGNGWYYEYKDVQNYNYDAIESHSFLTETFIETGILGFFALIVILIIFVSKFVKNRTKVNLIDMAFILLTLHSFIDFDMSFYCINVLWIVLLDIILIKYDEKKQNKKQDDNVSNKKKNLIFAIIVLINIFGVIMGVTATNVEQKNTKLLGKINELTDDADENQVINMIREYEENEKSEDFFSKLKEVNYSEVNDENMQFVYEKLQNRKVRVDTIDNVGKNKVLKRILETSRNEYWILKISDIVISENESCINNINNRSKNRLSEHDFNIYLNLQDTIYKLALEKKEQLNNN